MQERTLLVWALITACVGVVALFFLPPTPPVDVSGTVAWSNATLSRVILTDEVWVEHEYAPLVVGSCVQFAARPSFRGFASARVLGVAPPGSPHCQ